MNIDTSATQAYELDLLAALPLLRLRVLVEFENEALGIGNASEAWRGCIRSVLAPKTQADFLALFAPEMVSRAVGGTPPSSLNETTPGYTLHCQASATNAKRQWLHVCLIGNCANYAAAVVLAIDERATCGVGGGHLRYRVVDVEVQDPLGTWINIATVGGLGSLARQRAPLPHPSDTGVGSLSMHFYRRPYLVSRGVAQEMPPPLPLLVSFLTQRVARLTRWHGCADLEGSVRIEASKALDDATRCHMEACMIKGLPTMRVVGPLRRLMPFLMLGQEVGIGANTTIGWGRFSLASSE